MGAEHLTRPVELNQDNTSGFYRTTFTSGEKQAIALTTLKTDGNFSDSVGSTIDGKLMDDIALNPGTFDGNGKTISGLYYNS